VVAANQDSPWTGIPLEDFVNGLDDDPVPPQVLAPEPAFLSPSTAPASPFSSEKVAQGTARLRELAKPYVDGTKELGADGRGDEEVALEIRLIAKHIAKHDDKEGETNIFAIFLEACLHEWFADFVNHGDSKAMDTFRQRILQFVTENAG
jgi:hypothetical protein